jgi:hypothetical protein
MRIKKSPHKKKARKQRQNFSSKAKKSPKYNKYMFEIRLCNFVDFKRDQTRTHQYEQI